MESPQPEEIESGRVSPLDPDFLLVLFFAIGIDLLDLGLETFAWFGLGIPKLVGIFIDLIAFLAICGWIQYRLGRLTQTKRARIRALEQRLKNIQKLALKAEELAKLEKEALQRLSRARRILARILRTPLFRALIRATLAFIAEILPLLGLIPIWTISVLLMLREK